MWCHLHLGWPCWQPGAPTVGGGRREEGFGLDVTTLTKRWGGGPVGDLGPQRSGVEEERRGFGLDVTILTKRRGGGPVGPWGSSGQ